jgi:LmbE family N-acetylglucosaminyl deacetylase
MGERVIVLAPHPDDEAIGCGGMICLHQQQGDRVEIVHLTSGERGVEGMAEETLRSLREAEAKEAAHVLAAEAVHFLRLPDTRLEQAIPTAAQKLQPILAAARPDMIYLPHAADAHPDHGAARPIAQTALANLAWNKLPQVRGYEVWSPMARYGWVEDITAVMGRKLRAIRCYRSQLRLLRYDHAVRGLNAYRGRMAAGSRYAEAFLYHDPHLAGPA